MKTITPPSLLARAAVVTAAAAGAVGPAGSAQAAPAAPSGPTPTDVCAQQLAVAPVVGQWTGTLHSACTSGSALVHHPLG